MRATRCEQHARYLLDAWVGGDSGRIREALAQPLAAAPAQGTDEQERMELLESIAARLKTRPVAVDAPAGVVSMRLLRHLAASRN